jgi:hypothetical protein
MTPQTRRLPAALIFEVSAIAIRRVINLNLQNKAMHFFVKQINSLFFTVILQAADWHARGLKVWFFSEYLCCFFGRCFETMRTDPSYPSLFFCQCRLSSHHVLA